MGIAYLSFARSTAITRSAGVLATIAVVTAGCGPNPPGEAELSGPAVITSVSPSIPPATTASPSTSPTTIDLGVITADGYGPYQVGMSLVAADNAGLLVDQQSTEGCPGWVVAKGTDGYAEISLIFYDGNLLWLDVDKPGHATATGAQVGMAYPDVKAGYGGATEFTGPPGEKALSVRTGANTVFLRFDGSGKLARIEAGVADTLEFRYTDGEGC